jgi:hypothetical protein
MIHWASTWIIWIEVSNSSPDIVRMTKSRRLRWAGYAACMEGLRKAHTILVVNLKGLNHLNDLGVDRRY